MARRSNVALVALVCLMVLDAGYAANEGTGPSPYHLPVLGHVPYLMNTDWGECDFLTEPCAPLADCWGYTDPDDGREYALVGVSNGIDVVDVTVPDDPVQVGTYGWIPGCITEWRDLKTYETTLFVVNDQTPNCQCYEQPCEDQIYVITDGTTDFMRVSIGSVTVPLSVSGPISGELVAADPPLACYGVDNPEELAGKIALVDAGICMFASKIKSVQEAGAIAIVIINDRDDIIYPSMNGNGTDINIPGGLVGMTDGATLREMLGDNSQVQVQFNENFRVDSPIYSAPEGLVLIDLSDPYNPELLYKTRQWFDFAHNILVDTVPGRPYLYTCGTDTANGGVMVFDISEPHNPILVGTWNVTYLHDMDVRKRGDKYLLFGPAIYDGRVYVIDVTDPTQLGAHSTVDSFKTLAWPHNSAMSEDGTVIYLTHEDRHMPVTIWDVYDLSNPVIVGNLSINAERGTIPHNALVRGDRLWLSYYTEGVVVYDIARPTHPVILARNDTSPLYDVGFHGVWGIYPFRTDGDTFVYASDIEEGLFVLELQLVEEPINPVDPNGPAVWFPAFVGVDGPPVSASFFAVILPFLLFVITAAACSFVTYKRMGLGDLTAEGSAGAYSSLGGAPPGADDSA